MDRMHDEKSIQKIVGKLYMHMLYAFEDFDTDTGVGALGQWYWIDDKPNDEYFTNYKVDLEKLYANLVREANANWVLEKTQLLMGSGFRQTSTQRMQLLSAHLRKHPEKGIYLDISASYPIATHHTGIGTDIYLENTNVFKWIYTTEIWNPKEER